MTDLAKIMREIDIKGAMREAFNKCPKCAHRLEAGAWLKICPNRGCQWYGIK